MMSPQESYSAEQSVYLAGLVAYLGDLKRFGDGKSAYLRMPAIDGDRIREDLQELTRGAFAQERARAVRHAETMRKRRIAATLMPLKAKTAGH